MRAGPKAAPDETPIRRPRATGSRQFELFCARNLLVPKGTGALKPLRIRPWQKALVGSVWDQNPQPRLAAWCLPRGQGKSSLCAALGLWDLHLGEEGASVVVVATDERQAAIIFGIAARMTELNPELAKRTTAYRDRLVIPSRGASFACLPAEAKRLEGLDFTLGLMDEVGVIGRDTFEVMALASGKRERSTLLGIGTPGADPDNVLADLRSHADDADPSFAYREHSAAGFEDHPVDCSHCWETANPALGDFLHRDAMTALLPPKTREPTFRRSRLCQFVTGAGDEWLSREAWDACREPERKIPDGATAVIALDGSFSADATALSLVSVEPKPRIELLGLWEPPITEPSYRVPMLDVEAKIRSACTRYRVVEITADPYRFQRTLEVLASDGLPVTEFPQSAQRMSPATTALAEAIHNHEVSHTGDPDLARHVGNCIVRDDARGVRVAKVSKDSRRKIDAAVATIMAFARARWHATNVPRRSRAVAFK
jgi:phage terminase large subunit-like protein